MLSHPDHRQQRDFDIRFARLHLNTIDGRCCGIGVRLQFTALLRKFIFQIRVALFQYIQTFLRPRNIIAFAPDTAGTACRRTEAADIARTERFASQERTQDPRLNGGREFLL